MTINERDPLKVGTCIHLTMPFRRSEEQFFLVKNKEHKNGSWRYEGIVLSQDRPASLLCVRNSSGVFHLKLHEVHHYGAASEVERMHVSLYVGEQRRQLRDQARLYKRLERRAVGNWNRFSRELKRIQSP